MISISPHAALMRADDLYDLTLAGVKSQASLDDVKAGEAPVPPSRPMNSLVPRVRALRLGANLGTEQSLSFPDHTTTSSYDAVGNRLSSLGVSPYIYNSPNQLTSTPSLTYTYDYNGNTLTKSDGTSYAWDYDNQLKQVTLPGSGGTVNFKDDPFGRRVQKFGPNRTTNYVYDGPNLLEEMDGNENVIARYTQRPAIDQPRAELRSGTTSYYQQDALSSVTSLSNSTARQTPTSSTATVT